MNVGDFFVTLGVKGADQTAAALSKTNNGLKTIYSSSLAAKAAVLGAIYGIERMTSDVGSMGAGLSQFNEKTGLSILRLQQLQKAARNAGVDAKGLGNEVSGLQDKFVSMGFEGFTNTLATISRSVGGIDVAKARQDTFYLLEKLRQFIQVTPPDRAKYFTKDLISDDLFVTLRRAKTPIDQLKGNFLSANESKAAERFKINLQNFYDNFEKQIARTVIKHPGIVSDVQKLSLSMLKLVDALVGLADKVYIFDGLSNLINSLSMIADKAGSVASSGMFKNILQHSAPVKFFHLSKSKEIEDFFGNKNKTLNNFDEKIKNSIMDSLQKDPSMKDFKIIIPNPKAQGQSRNNEINIDQTVNNYGVEKANQASDELRKATDFAARQIPTLLGAV